MSDDADDQRAGQSNDRIRRLNRTNPIICRRCHVPVTTSILFLCTRKRGSSGMVRYAECSCRGVDANGRCIIPGPLITAEDLAALNAEIALTTVDAIYKRSAGCACGKPAVALCDQVVRAIADETLASALTCDAGICATHRVKVGRNRDLCQAHAKAAPRNTQRIKAIELVLPLDLP